MWVVVPTVIEVEPSILLEGGTFGYFNAIWYHLFTGIGWGLIFDVVNHRSLHFHDGAVILGHVVRLVGKVTYLQVSNPWCHAG